MTGDGGWRRWWQDYRPSKTMWFWSCAGCVIATIVVGFVWGGWVTGGSAAQMAENAASTARSRLAALVCVSRFTHSPTAAVELASLRKTPEWERGSFIKKGGWVTLPGMNRPMADAADLCASELVTAKLPRVKAAG